MNQPTPGADAPSLPPEPPAGGELFTPASGDTLKPEYFFRNKKPGKTWMSVGQFEHVVSPGEIENYWFARPKAGGVIHAAVIPANVADVMPGVLKGMRGQETNIPRPEMLGGEGTNIPGNERKMTPEEREIAEKFKSAERIRAANGESRTAEAWRKLEELEVRLSVAKANGKPWLPDLTPYGKAERRERMATAFMAALLQSSHAGEGISDKLAARAVEATNALIGHLEFDDIPLPRAGEVSPQSKAQWKEKSHWFRASYGPKAFEKCNVCGGSPGGLIHMTKAAEVKVHRGFKPAKDCSCGAPASWGHPFGGSLCAIHAKEIGLPSALSTHAGWYPLSEAALPQSFTTAQDVTREIDRQLAALPILTNASKYRILVGQREGFLMESDWSARNNEPVPAGWTYGGIKVVTRTEPGVRVEVVPDDHRTIIAEIAVGQTKLQMKALKPTRVFLGPEELKVVVAWLRRDRLWDGTMIRKDKTDDQWFEHKRPDIFGLTIERSEKPGVEVTE